jgi:hypothetical protein
METGAVAKMENSNNTLVRTVADLLFPPPAPIIQKSEREDRHFVDTSVDENLEAAIIDLEMRGADEVCLKTLNEIHGKLRKARVLLGCANEG